MINNMNDKRIRDFDLKLYRDIAKQLSQFRLTAIGKYSNKEYTILVKKHNRLLKRLAKKLGVGILIG